MNHMPWNDDGKAAGALFGWTHDNHLDSDIADSTAEAYGRYLGEHKGPLMDLGGQTLVNTTRNWSRHMPTACRLMSTILPVWAAVCSVDVVIIRSLVVISTYCAW